MTQSYVGLDVHSKETVYFIQDETGKEIGRGRFSTSREEIGEFVRRFGFGEGTALGLESGTSSRLVATELAKLKMRPIVIHAEEVRRKAHRSRQKTDMRDAMEICEGIRTGQYKSIVHVPTDRVAQLREILAVRQHFVRSRTREINSVKSSLRGRGMMKDATRSLLTNDGWEEVIEGLQTLDPWLAKLVVSRYEVWKNADAQVEELDALIKELAADRKKEIDRLKTIPGVGDVIATTIVATVADVKRFKTSKHFSSYVGLTPSSYSSGEKVVHGKITKTGSRICRAMLVQAAQHSAKAGSPFHPLYSRIAFKKGCGKAKVAVAHLIARIAWAILTRDEDFNHERINVEAGPFESRRVVGFRRRRVEAAAGPAKEGSGTP